MRSSLCAFEVRLVVVGLRLFRTFLNSQRMRFIVSKQMCAHRSAYMWFLCICNRVYTLYAVQFFRYVVPVYSQLEFIWRGCWLCTVQLSMAWGTAVCSCFYARKFCLVFDIGGYSWANAVCVETGSEHILLILLTVPSKGFLFYIISSILCLYQLVGVQTWLEPEAMAYSMQVCGY